MSKINEIFGGAGIQFNIVSDVSVILSTNMKWRIFALEQDAVISSPCLNSALMESN